MRVQWSVDCYGSTLQKIEEHARRQLRDFLGLDWASADGIQLTISADPIVTKTGGTVVSYEARVSADWETS